MGWLESIGYAWKYCWIYPIRTDSSENPCFSYADNHRIDTNRRDVSFGCLDTPFR